MRRFTILFLLAVMCMAGPLMAADLSYADIARGEVVPHTLKLKDLQAGGWCSLQAQIASLLEMVSRLSADDIPPAMPSFFTQGKTLTVGKDSYLIAYQYARPKNSFFAALARGEFDEADMDEEDAQPQLVTGETTVYLTLVHLGTAGSLVNITPFNLEREIAAANSRIKSDDDEEDEAPLTPEEQSASNLKQLAIALQMYTQDNEERFPSAKTWREDLRNTYSAGDNLVHPVTKRPYLYNVALSNKDLGAIQNPAITVMVYEASCWPDGKRYVGFVDGHVAKLTQVEWGKACKRSGVM